MKDKMEDALRESEANLKAIIENSIESIWSIDTQYRIQYVNEVFATSFKSTFGVTLSKGVNILESLPEPLRLLWKNRYDRAFNREHFVFLDKIELGNTDIYIEVAMNPIVVNDKVVGASFYGKDISTQKAFELQLIAAKDKAEQSDRLKTAFLQNMSHEIRTPMNAIMGFSSLLADYYNDKESLAKFAEIINVRCNDLLEIIDDILNISKIESGHLTLNYEPCDLNQTFSELSLFFTEYQKRNNKLNIQFELKMCDLAKNKTVLVDKGKLKQILINLISNAFKFTKSGSIEGVCQVENNNTLLFYVRDTGVGIPAGKQEAIFERFTQLHHYELQNTGGTGLGLSIVKGLVKLLNGKVWLESEPNMGSTFYFSMPVTISGSALINETEIEHSTHFQFNNKTILIVEDDFYNSEYLKAILSGTGLKILSTVYGKESVQIAASQHIDLILMDIQLPDFDGYESTKLIKQNQPNIKIIAQTAFAAHDESQKALKAGCVDYISKPIKKEMLLDMLNKHLT